MASLDDRRAGFKRYKEDVERRGKPFYPYAMFHDTVMSLVVVCVIVGLAVIWKYTDLLGVLYTDKADPGTVNFVPRPDWYFYFLFYLLRIFKWPESVILGTILDGRADVQGGYGQGGACLGGCRPSSDLGAEGGIRRQRDGGRRRQPFRAVGLHELPYVPGHRHVEPRRA